jgi:hypothetical protein
METYITGGVRQNMAQDIEYAMQIHGALEKFRADDWGEVVGQDKKMNDSSDSLYALGVYRAGRDKVWIIREHDGSATTVLYPDEY